MNFEENKTIGYEQKAGKYLTFVLDGRRYAFSIKNIIEIIGIQDITPVPESPSYMKGIINLRGRIIPLIDMRLRFRKEEIPYNKRTSIVIVRIRDVDIGFIVDRVEEVVDILAKEISPPPVVTMDGASKYVMAIGKIKGDIVLLLDHDRLFSNSELRTLSESN